MSDIQWRDMPWRDWLYRLVDIVEMFLLVSTLMLAFTSPVWLIAIILALGGYFKR